MQHWHLIFTKPGKETLVSAQLGDRNVQAYLPTLQIERGHRRGIRVEPFFPNYVFVCIDLQAQAATDLRWMPGVSTFVHFGDDPVVVPDAVIETLQTQLRGYEDTVIEKPKVNFRPGQEVRIVKGALEGFHAIFQRNLSGSQRAEVLLDFLKRSNRTQVSLDALEPLAYH
jgi:transcriptional antiterminator RfaH